MDLKKLNERHQRIKRLKARGLTNAQIASELGTSVATIRQTVQAPLFKSAVKDYQERLDSRTLDSQAGPDPVRERLKEVALEALDTSVEIMRGPEIGLAQKSAFDILNRAGYSPKDSEPGQRSAPIIITGSQVALLTTALRESTDSGQSPNTPTRVQS